MGDSDVQYRNLRLQKTQELDDRNRFILQDRAASMAEFRAQCRRRDEERNAQTEAMAQEARRTLAKLSSLSTVSRPDETRSEMQREQAGQGSSYIAPPPQKLVVLEQQEQPVKSPQSLINLKERAAAEQQYWKWARQLKHSGRCIVDQSWFTPSGAIKVAEVVDKPWRLLLPSPFTVGPGGDGQSEQVDGQRRVPKPISTGAISSLPWKQKEFIQQQDAAIAHRMQHIRQKLNIDMTHRDNRASALCESIRAGTVEHQRRVKAIQTKLKSKTLMLEDFYAPSAPIAPGSAGETAASLPSIILSSTNAEDGKGNTASLPCLPAPSDNSLPELGQRCCSKCRPE